MRSSRLYAGFLAGLLVAGPTTALGADPSNSDPSVTPPPAAAPDKRAPDKMAPRGPSGGSGIGRNEPLGSALSRSQGVIHPPPGVDPGMDKPAPPIGTMPVMPPPGSPGVNPTIEPK